MGLTTQYNHALSAVDRDGNRQISCGEVEAYLKNMYQVEGIELPELTEEEFKVYDLGNRTDVAAHIPDVAAAFSMQNKDGDGRLSNEELGDLHLVKWHESFKSFDNSGDDQIRLDEFKAPIKDIVHRAIHAVDRDREEKISHEDMKNLANPDTLPDTIMKTIGVNGEGQLTYSKLKKPNTDYNNLNDVNDALNHLDNTLNNGTVTSIVTTMDRPPAHLDNALNSGKVTSTVTSIDMPAADQDNAPISSTSQVARCYTIIIVFVVLITLFALNVYHYQKSRYTPRLLRQTSMAEA